MNIKMVLQDPSILIATGVIFIAIVPLIWAVGRLFKKAPSMDEGYAGAGGATDELFNSPQAAQQDPPTTSYPDFSAVPPRDTRPAPSVRETSTTPPAASKEMVERLDTMSQRLTDMQAVLQRQTSGPAAGAPLTPETIDKLLKIISNVTQQVDMLQRSLGVAPSAPLPSAPPPRASVPRPGPLPTGPTLSQPGAPATPPSSAPPPVGPPKVSAPGVGGIGIAGGALSRPPSQGFPPASSPPGK